MSEVIVNLGERSYAITIEHRAISKLGAIIAAVRKPSAAVIVSNPTVARHYAETALESIRAADIRAELILIPAGERFKTLGTVKRIYEMLLDMNIDRAGALIALGGGVVGDVVGFAAATYMRGIDFYQVPTTLLAQVDASVGGKTGVDLPQGKNLVGAFYQPRAVVIDTATLATLPARELRSGLAEVVKHGIIYDQGFFQYIDRHAADLLHRHEEALNEAVLRSVEIKRDVVQSDERESGLRAILNYGHTIGHAIEVVSGYGKYRHGEASAIGMVTEALVSESEGHADRGLASNVARVLAKLKLPTAMDESLETSELLRAIELDKKVVGGTIRLALPTSIGRCGVYAVSRDVLARAIEIHRTWRPE